MSERARDVAATDAETIDLLRDSVADYCRRSLDVGRLRALRGGAPAFDGRVWREMCELGWPAIVVPETAGGLGLGAKAVGAVCRELGQVIAPEPMLECGVAVAGVLARLDTVGARDHLKALLAGDTLITIALTENGEDLRAIDAGVTAITQGTGFVLNGTSRNVALAVDMDAYLIPARFNDAPALFYVQAHNNGVRCTPRRLADGTTAGDLDFDDAELDADALLGTGSPITDAVSDGRELARLAASAYLLGLAEALFDVTLDYLRTREQFGRPIGSFQALQHRAVDLFIQKTLANAVVDECLAVFDGEPGHTARACAASRAKYRAAEAALLIARQAVQLHGGIGFTDECNVGLYLNRALVLAARYGNATFHCRRLARLNPVGDDSDDAGSLNAIVDEPPDGDWNALTDDAFRATVRRWLENEYPADQRYPSQRPRWDEIKPWYLKLAERGWVAPAWPIEHGGMGLAPAKLLIYIEEQERWGVARAPDMGIQMVGPLLINHGTLEQRARYLPRILAGDEVWCQGYSEPNAGSDLASLKTEALPDGDEFVINGQKTWTTLAQDATHMFCLARTSTAGKPQEGISFFFIDLDQPGVTIRPIRNLAGQEEFCEVFLDDVRVAADCLVGEINQGWTIAKALLGFERIFLGSPKQSQYALKRLEEIALACGLYDDAAFADKIARLKLDVLDLETTYKRFADIVRRGEVLGADVSLLKIWATETFARLSELMLETAGADGAAVGKIDFNGAHIDILSQFYNARPATIYAGSNEIQRNILSKHVLRLPDR